VGQQGCHQEPPQRGKLIKLFSSSLTPLKNKLERLPVASIFRLALYVLARPGANLSEAPISDQIGSCPHPQILDEAKKIANYKTL
jgi:hypothetical protein